MAIIGLDPGTSNPAATVIRSNRAMAADRVSFGQFARGGPP